MADEAIKAQGNSKDQPTQLNSLCYTLSCHLENRDDLGALIGYCVYEGLRTFNTTSNSEPEIKFQEIKAIYTQIEWAVQECAANQSYEHTCQLNKNTATLFRGLQSDTPNKTYVSNSKLLEEIAETLSRKRGAFEDIVRRQGRALFEEVSSKGLFKRPCDALTEDYNSIRNCFTKSR